MDSYRVEKQAAVRVQMADEDAEIDPAPPDGGGQKQDPELNPLSIILQEFNDLFGNTSWLDADRVSRLITQDIPSKVAADAAYRNAREHSDRQNARIEHDHALGRAMTGVFKDDMQLFKLYTDNEDFKRWLANTVFRLTYEQPQPPSNAASMT